jgi:hypothetical protein
MVTSIYKKIDLDSVGGSHDILERYRDFLVDALIATYPDATIEVEVTTRESGVMPMVIEADTYNEEREAQAYITQTWDTFCAQR